LYGYAVLIVSFAFSMSMIWRVSGFRSNERAVSSNDDEDAVLSWLTRLLWLAAAFVPSALTLAVTNHISLNIGSFPFLWIAPLALYLLTFVIAFARQVRIPVGIASSIATVVLVVLFPIATVG